MKHSVALCLLALMASCTPIRKPIPRPTSPPPVSLPRPSHLTAAPTPKPAPPQPAIPSAPMNAPLASQREIAGIEFNGVSFDSRSHRLLVADQPSGPDSIFSDAQSAAQAMNGIAAVNAGFFTPEGAPLGLVITGGKRAGSWNSASSLGSGIWYESTAGHSAITRREKLDRTSANSMRELLQAGPMLVANGQSVSALEATKTSARTMILWDGGSRWWIGHASPCTLANLAVALSSNSPTSWPVRQALNLDGGRSADLWISEKAAGGPVSIRPPWNRPVRNFLVLAPR